MSGFAVIRVFGNDSPVDAFSYPNRVSFCVGDDGTGGGSGININGLGVNDPTIGGAVDLRTLFGATLFRSIPLLSAFRSLPAANSNAAEVQLVQNVEVTVVAVSGATTKQPAVNYLGVAVAGQNVPFLQLVGPGVVGSWRIDLRLRNTLTG